MSDVAIRVEGLGKRYRIGARRAAYGTLRESLTQAIQAPLRGAASLLRGQSRDTSEADRAIWALKDVSFEVKQGEVMGIIGRNGAGKSTLLKVLSRITEPTEGYAEIRGRIGSLLEVGTGFHPELTGRENIYLSGAILGMKRAEIERKFDEIVAFAEMDTFIDTPVKHYSSGMYVRLAFAVAAHLEPEILMVDEVLAVGDIAFQHKCLGKMGEVARGGRTVLFVSHNMPAVGRLCPRAILLDSAQLIDDGASPEVIGTYLRKVLQSSEARTWTWHDAPGTDRVKLISVQLLRDGQATASAISVEEEIKVRISYCVTEPDVKFRCAVQFYTQGVCAFASVEPQEAVRAQPGLYHSTVVVPPNLLAEGEYSVGISIFASRGVKNHYVTERDAVLFEVYDSMTGNSARGDYAERIAGVVRPSLRWQTSYEGSRVDP